MQALGESERKRGLEVITNMPNRNRNHSSHPMLIVLKHLSYYYHFHEGLDVIKMIGLMICYIYLLRRD